MIGLIGSVRLGVLGDIGNHRNGKNAKTTVSRRHHFVDRAHADGVTANHAQEFYFRQGTTYFNLRCFSWKIVFTRLMQIHFLKLAVRLVGKNFDKKVESTILL